LIPEEYISTVAISALRINHRDLVARIYSHSNAGGGCRECVPSPANAGRKVKIFAQFDSSWDSILVSPVVAKRISRGTSAQ
jgi:hypothetical protein